MSSFHVRWLLMDEIWSCNSYQILSLSKMVLDRSNTKLSWSPNIVHKQYGCWWFKWATMITKYCIKLNIIDELKDKLLIDGWSSKLVCCIGKDWYVIIKGSLILPYNCLLIEQATSKVILSLWILLTRYCLLKWSERKFIRKSKKSCYRNIYRDIK